MGNHRLSLLPERLAVCRLPAEAAYPAWAQGNGLIGLIRTPRALTVVCPERFVPAEVQAERGWRGLVVAETLAFELVGVLASLLNPLAEAGVSVFVLSTYETDILLFKEAALKPALEALRRAGHLVDEAPGTG